MKKVCNLSLLTETEPQTSAYVTISNYQAKYNKNILDALGD